MVFGFSEPPPKPSASHHLYTCRTVSRQPTTAFRETATLLYEPVNFTSRPPRAGPNAQLLTVAAHSSLFSEPQPGRRLPPPNFNRSIEEATSPTCWRNSTMKLKAEQRRLVLDLMLTPAITRGRRMTGVRDAPEPAACRRVNGVVRLRCIHSQPLSKPALRLAAVAGK